jgi:proteic killer suppression protein
VIVSYRGARTAACAARKRVKTLWGVERSAWIKLDRLAAAHTLHDLTALLSNDLETLKGKEDESYAIRIDERWRIVFEWPETSPGPSSRAGSRYPRIA